MVEKKQRKIRWGSKKKKATEASEKTTYPSETAYQDVPKRGFYYFKYN